MQPDSGPLGRHRSKDAVYRLDPKTGAVKAEIKTTDASRLLVTADGVWLNSHGVVEHIDPTSDQVVFGAKLGGNIKTA